MMCRRISLIGFVAFLTMTAVADPYWIAYEGDQFAETVGWQRFYGDESGARHGGAERSLQDGIFVLDSRWDMQVFDFNYLENFGNPGSDERFIAAWRMRVLENEGYVEYPDTSVVVALNGYVRLAIQYLLDRVEVSSAGEEWSIPIRPLAFHDYRLESDDAAHYSFWIDGGLVRTGSWLVDDTNSPFFSFGDGVQGARSLTEWDYVRFGVVPEPCPAYCLLIAHFAFGRRRFARLATH